MQAKGNFGDFATYNLDIYAAEELQVEQSPHEMYIGKLVTPC
jgi:hypothetical protein